jgi:hypothetical protein
LAVLRLTTSRVSSKRPPRLITILFSVTNGETAIPGQFLLSVNGSPVAWTDPLERLSNGFRYCGSPTNVLLEGNENSFVTSIRASSPWASGSCGATAVSTRELGNRAPP